MRRAVVVLGAAAAAGLAWHGGRLILARPDVADYLLVLRKAVAGRPIMSKVSVEPDAGAGIVVRAAGAAIVRCTVTTTWPSEAVDRLAAAQQVAGPDRPGATLGGFGEHGEGDVSFSPERLAEAAADRPRCARSCGRVADVQVTVGVWGPEHAETLGRALYAPEGDEDGDGPDGVVADVEWLCAPCAAAEHPDGEQGVDHDE